MKMALILALFCSSAYAECVKRQVKIAVIDTGFGYNKLPKDANLCYWGHKDFTKKGLRYIGEDSFIPVDTVGHGTNIVGIIEDYANKFNVNYCIVILKFYSKDQTNHQNLRASISAINFANDQIGADIINYSGGGPDSDPEEQMAVTRFLNRGGKFIAAAGNDGKKIGSGDEDYYPAMYDKRIVVVGSTDKYGIPSKWSNHGNFVNRWEIGENVEAYGITLSGTSQATAIATGKILAENKNQCILKK